MTFKANITKSLVTNSNSLAEDFILFEKQTETINDLVLRSHPYCRLIFSGNQPLHAMLGTNMTITLPENELLFLAPYVFYRLQPREEEISALSVRFAPATNFFISPYWDEARVLVQRAQHGLHFTGEVAAMVQSLYNDLNLNYSLTNVCKIVTIFDMLAKNMPPENITDIVYQRHERDHRFCQVTEEYIQSRLETNISVMEMADKLHLSVSSFHQKFRQHFECSFHNYLLKQKIFHARHLLSATNLTVAEIAERLNFSSPSHFTAAFKRFCDTTPRLYRQDNQVIVEENRKVA